MATTLHCPQLLSINRVNQYTGLFSWYKLGLSRLLSSESAKNLLLGCLQAVPNFLTSSLIPAAQYPHTTWTQLHAYMTKQVLILRDLRTNTTLALSDKWDNRAVHTAQILYI